MWQGGRLQIAEKGGTYVWTNLTPAGLFSERRAAGRNKLVCVQNERIGVPGRVWLLGLLDVCGKKRGGVTARLREINTRYDRKMKALLWVTTQHRGRLGTHTHIGHAQIHTYLYTWTHNSRAPTAQQLHALRLNNTDAHTPRRTHKYRVAGQSHSGIVRLGSPCVTECEYK